MLMRLLKHPIVSFAIVAWVLWLAGMIWIDGWHLFADNWFMSVTMIFGSFIAGSTSEGGGAVAFPVMTLFFEIQPAVARDFSLMIQSVGMTAASIAIYCLKIPVAHRAIVPATLGGTLGLVLGIEVLSPIMPAPYTKMFFVSLWLSFGIVLYRIAQKSISKAADSEDPILPFGKLVFFGIIGGLVSGLVGNGIDIVIFSVLVLRYGVSEQKAIPTSVVLMAVHSLIGFAWRSLGSETPISDEALNYWLVSIPVVVLGAPCGAKFIVGKSRLFIVRFLLLSFVAQFISALVLIEQTLHLLAFSVVTLLAGLLIFPMQYAKQKAGPHTSVL